MKVLSARAGDNTWSGLGWDRRFRFEVRVSVCVRIRVAFWVNVSVTIRVTVDLVSGLTLLR